MVRPSILSCSNTKLGHSMAIGAAAHPDKEAKLQHIYRLQYLDIALQSVDVVKTLVTLKATYRRGHAEAVFFSPMLRAHVE